MYRFCMETAACASGNRGNSVSALPAVTSSEGTMEYHPLREVDPEEGSSVFSRPKVEEERTSSDPAQRPSDSTGFQLHQRIQSENAVGSTSDMFHGPRPSRRSALYPQPHHTSHSSGGISPMAMNNPWPASSLFSHQLQSNPGQPSPPSSRRGSFSYTNGPYAVLDSPFQCYMPQRTSFSFASDLSAPVGIPGVSAAPLPSLDFVDDDTTMQSIFHLNPMAQAPLYYPSLAAEIPSLPSRRESRGESHESFLPPPLSGSRSHSSGTPQPRGRGRPAKRSRATAASHHLPAETMVPALHPVRDDIPLIPVPQVKQEPGGPQMPHPAFIGAPVPSQHVLQQQPNDSQLRKRRNSAVSLMLLRDPSLATAPTGRLADALRGHDTPTSASETPSSPAPQRKKRKRASSDDDDDDDDGDFAADAGALKGTESFHVADEDDEYVSESEASAAKRAKPAPPAPTPRKPTGSARTGSSHWPVLKMEPVILPRTQQQLLDASYSGDGDGDDEDKRRNWGTGRKKIRIEFIENKLKRQITFSKRKSGMMKKIHELTTLTGTEALLILVSETGHIYSYATPRMVSLVDDPDVNPIKNALESYDDTQAQVKPDAASRSTRSGRSKSVKGGSAVSSSSSK